jgi:hypothetical protein
MVKTVADIAVNVTADIGPLVSGMAKAEASMSRFDRVARAAGAKLSSFGAGATALGAKMSIASAAIGAAAGAALVMTRNAANMGEEIDNASRAAGLAPEYFQEMRYAIGEVADISDQDFAAAMVRMNRTLGEAKSGSEAATKALKAIGITQDQISSGTLTAQQVLDAYVSSMDGVTDPALAAAISTDIFGKAGARMGGLMAGAGDEVGRLRDRATELGIVMSGDAVRASDEFNEKWAEVEKQLQAVQIAIATVLMPVIVDTLLPALTGTVIPAIVRVINTIGEWVTAFQGLPEPVQAAVGVLVAAFAAGGPLLIGIGLVASALAAGGPLMVAIAAFTAGAALSLAAWTAWSDQIGPVIESAVGFIVGQFNGLLLVLEKITAAITWIKDAAATVAGPDGGGQYRGAVFGGGQVSGAGVYGNGQMSGSGTDALNGGSAGADTLGTAIGDTVAQAARDALGIRSPSAVFAEIGVSIGEGLAQGVASTQSMVAASVTALGDTAVAATGGMASQVLGILGQMFQGSKAIAGAQALVNAWAGASEALKLPFPSNLLAFGKVLATGMSAVRAIQGAHPGGGGGGGGGSSAGGATATAPSYSANVTLVGDSFTGDQVAKLFKDLNEGLGRGFSINMAQT